MSENSTQKNLESGDGKKHDMPEAKKPCKGILKNSSSFDKQCSSANFGRKSAKFDELNVLQTYHPPDKDYGHMKIDEPKTPFSYNTEQDPGQDFDPDVLAEKLRLAANKQTPAFAVDVSSDEEIMETPSERVHRLEFEKRRKAHYNEFKAVMLARKLIQVELEGEDSEDEPDKEISHEMLRETEFAHNMVEAENSESSNQMQIDGGKYNAESEEMSAVSGYTERNVDMLPCPQHGMCRCHCSRQHQ